MTGQFSSLCRAKSVSVWDTIARPTCVLAKPVVDAGSNALYAPFSNDSGMDGQCDTDAFFVFQVLWIEYKSNIPLRLLQSSKSAFPLQS